MSGESDLIDVTVHLHAETEKAIRVSDDGINSHGVWLPKSQVEYEKVYSEQKLSNIFEVTLPEWLAKEKGLI
jgi:hypothetical protein